MTQTSNNEIKSIIEKNKQELIKAKKSIKSRRVYLNLNKAEFKELFLLKANKILIERGIKKEFIIDEENKHILHELFLYFTGNEYYKGCLNKGILIIGKYGTGKTLILTAIARIVNEISSKKITVIHAKEFPAKLVKEDISFFSKRPLFIDDIGKESKEINNYGTIVRPFQDVTAIRYDLGAWTFATSNYELEKSLKTYYGETTTDRMKEMFNIHTLTGESRRE